MFFNVKGKIRTWRNSLINKTPILYFRDQGPVCYEAQILNAVDKSDNLLKLLESTDLDWFWESLRERESDKTLPAQILPELRHLTKLHPGNKMQFIQDFQDTDVDGYSRFIAIFGLDKDKLVAGSLDDEIILPLKNFLLYEDCPIRVIVVQVSDSTSQFIYVPHQPVAQVSKLLSFWGLLPQLVQIKKPYNKLYLAKIESLMCLRLEQALS